MVRTILENASDLHVRLKHLYTDIITPDLFAYLASYSGLETLSLQNYDESWEARAIVSRTRSSARCSRATHRRSWPSYFRVAGLRGS
jgi:hypothetical protein